MPTNKQQTNKDQTVTDKINIELKKLCNFIMKIYFIQDEPKYPARYWYTFENSLIRTSI